MHSNGRANSLLRAGNSSVCDSARDSGCTDDPHRVPSMTVQATRSNQHRVAMSTLHLAEGAAGAPEAMASQRGRRAPTAPVAGPKGSSSNSRKPIRDEPRAWRAARDQAHGQIHVAPAEPSNAPLRKGDLEDLCGGDAILHQRAYVSCLPQHAPLQMTASSSTRISRRGMARGSSGCTIRVARGSCRCCAHEHEPP